MESQWVPWPGVLQEVAEKMAGMARNDNSAVVLIPLRDHQPQQAAQSEEQAGDSGGRKGLFGFFSQ